MIDSVYHWLVILIIIQVCVSIVGTYVLLNAENYKWRWTSFLSGCSIGLYIFIYCIYFYFYKTNDCVLYNVDAYAKDIVSVTVTFPYGGSQDGTLNCAFGTQAITAPTAGQTTLSKKGEYKFVAPEGCKYFALSTFAQSKNVQVTSIVIEYLK